MNQTTQGKGAGRRGREEDRSMLSFNNVDATSMVKRVRQEASDHPYRTIGVAAVAGLILSSRVGRTLAGWAGMRVGWDILLAILRERGEGLEGRPGRA